MTNLSLIADTIQKLAEATSAALKCEIQVFDNECCTLISTVSFKQANKTDYPKQGEKAPRGHIIKHVTKTGKPIIVANPGFHPVCHHCKLHKNCYTKFSIVYPIEYKGQCIGTILLNGYNNSQHKILSKNADQYLDFVKNITNLLTSKIREYETLEKSTLTNNPSDVILNTLEYGVIAIDTKGHITSINKKTTAILNISTKELIDYHITEILPSQKLVTPLKTRTESLDNLVIYEKGTNSKVLKCSSYPIIINSNITGAVINLSDYSNVEKPFQQLSDPDTKISFDTIICTSNIMKELKANVKRAAQGFFNILLEGESGTGKELFARAIHDESPFKNGNFVAINCSAIPENLLESELFGYETGAFTGAKKGGKAGKIELADGGSLFLDEIGEMPLYLQAKLLRVLQNRTIERVGGTQKKQINTRIISATNQNLYKMVQEGTFREDLYYRLNVIPFEIPPLRKRKEDIPILLSFFLKKYSTLINKPIKGFSSEALRLSTDYPWPGNVRELENAVEYALSFVDSQWIEINNLPPKIQHNVERFQDESLTLKETNIQTESELIESLLEKHGTSVKAKDEIAKILGISRATLYRKLRNLKN